jgi:hypothetical protein
MLRLLLFKHKVWRKPVEDSSRIQNLDVPQGGMTNTSLLAARIIF